MSKNTFITASDVMNHEYCKRINYYRHVLKLSQFTTQKEYEGRKKYDDFAKKSKRNKIIKDSEFYKVV